MFKTEFRAHPLMIWRVMRPYLFILVLPLVRAAYQYLVSGQINGLFALETLAIAATVILAVMEWFSIKITTSDSAITVEKGFFIKSRAIIDENQISSICLKQGILDFIFNSVDCYINTEAGKPKKSDFNIKLSLSDAKLFYKRVRNVNEMKTVRFSAYRIALLAATTSTAVTGMIIGVPVINQTGKFVGIALSDVLLQKINLVSSKFGNIFPPVVNTITLIFVLAYATAFVVAFLKNVNFKIKSDQDNIEVQSGLIVRKVTFFKKTAINNICFEQTPLMRLLNKHSMAVSVGGYGDSKGEKAVVVPIGDHNELESRLKTLFCVTKSRKDLVVSKKSLYCLYRFLFVPIWSAVAILIAAIVLVTLFGRFTRFIVFITIVALSIDIYYGSLCWRNYKQGGFDCEKYVIAVGSTGFTIRELYCDKNKIGIIKLYQTPADRRRKTCKLKFMVRSETANWVKVKNLDKKRVIENLNAGFDLNINE